ncbi:hypothetical protein F5B21DRAFT_510173 [Xylaria acuta]|nr:hypothetical protein F5B21DRAFT_510173 [Xylaria acuta]
MKARIDHKLKGKIKQSCRQLRISPSHFYLAVFRTLIFRHTSNTANNYCIGVADGNRKDADAPERPNSLDITNGAVQENRFTLSVNTDLYTNSGAELLMRNYLHLLKQFVSNPSAQISKPTLYPEEGPESRSEWPSTMVDRIDYIVYSYADRRVLKDTIQLSMTYKHTSIRIKQLTAQLIDRHVILGDVIGICQQSGVDWMCSLFAILRSVAACVPLDLRGVREGNEVVLQQSSHAFDISILQAFTYLGWGGVLVIADASKRHDPAAICDLIVSEDITFTLVTPTEHSAQTRVADLNAPRHVRRWSYDEVLGPSLQAFE